MYKRDQTKDATRPAISSTDKFQATHHSHRYIVNMENNKINPQIATTATTRDNNQRSLMDLVGDVFMDIINRANDIVDAARRMLATDEKIASDVQSLVIPIP